MTTAAQATQPISPLLPFRLPAEVDTVLLDIGQVLTGDPWETMLLTPGRGLAAILDMPVALVQEAGSRLWENYCRVERTAEEYWDDLAIALGRRITSEQRSAAESVLVANELAEQIVEGIAASGRRVGIISNNTAFWYPAQLRLLPALVKHAEADLVFLSHADGRCKGDEPSLFDIAAATVNPSTTLVVDDRMGNINQALNRGFHAAHYVMPTTYSPARKSAA